MILRIRALAAAATLLLAVPSARAALFRITVAIKEGTVLSSGGILAVASTLD